MANFIFFISQIKYVVAYNVKTVKSEYSCTIVQNKYNINKNLRKQCNFISFSVYVETQLRLMSILNCNFKEELMIICLTVDRGSLGCSPEHGNIPCMIYTKC